MKIRVKQGSIHVNDVSLVKQTPDAFVLHLDTRAKYAVVVDWETKNGGRVWLDKGGETLHADDTDSFTEVRLGLKGRGWEICAIEGRYTVQVFGVRGRGVPAKKRMIWRDDE